MEMNSYLAVLISANAEWRVVRDYFPDSSISYTPYGEWFQHDYSMLSNLADPVLFIHGGWGKVAAAASTQLAIDVWHPQLIVNLGTCGGFEGDISHGEIILVEKTIIYDIYEQMGDPDEHIQYYATDLDITWITQPYPIPVKRSVLVSGDRDLFSEDIPMLKAKYGAMAGDWESGAIAWVANKNHTPCLILRGVTDLVGGQGGEAYEGNVRYYYQNTDIVMKKLLDSLPGWLTKYLEHDVNVKIRKTGSQ